MDRLRVAVVGSWAYTHSDHTVYCLKHLNDMYDIAAYCDIDPDMQKKAVKREAYRDLPIKSAEEVLSDKSIDAVIIETAETLQAKTAALFAEAGFNIHMDKPGGTDICDFDRLMDTVSEKGLVFQSGYMYRYNPAVRKLYELADSGKLGDIISVEAEMSPWKYTEEMTNELFSQTPYGMMYYLGCHLVDIVYRLQGKPSEILPLSARSGVFSSPAKDLGFTVYKYPQGVSFVKAHAIEYEGFSRRQIRVFGTKGTALLSPLEMLTDGIYPVSTSAKLKLITDEGEKNFDFPVFGRYNMMMTDFYNMCKNGTKNEYSAEYEKEMFRMFISSCK